MRKGACCSIVHHYSVGENRTTADIKWLLPRQNSARAGSMLHLQASEVCWDFTSESCCIKRWVRGSVIVQYNQLVVVFSAGSQSVMRKGKLLCVLGAIVDEEHVASETIV